jgi:hypothetical protein
MIHGIYLKNRPKAKWHLVSIATSSETANDDLKEAQKQAVQEGFDNAEVAIKIFESSFYIPVFLDDVKDTKPLYN